MKTHINKTIPKYSFFLVLILLSFFLSSTSSHGLSINKINNIEAIKMQTSLIITKKTTLEELENIKKQMKDEGFEFNYSNVVYNEGKEIISISISYKDANNNSGNYSVGSEKPINDIIIISDGKQISVKSQGSGNQAPINQERNNEISENRQKMIEDRNTEMVKRRSEMEMKRAEKMNEMKEKQTRMRTRMEYERDSIFGDQRTKNSQDFNGNYNVITKNTTNEELLELEKNYQSENISFSYNQLERNANNLITRISITVNNGKGSVSTSRFGDGNDPIKDISVGVDPEYIIMKSAE